MSVDVRSATITVRAGSGSYPVEIGSGLLAEVGGRLPRKAGTRVFVVSSPELIQLWGESLLAGFGDRPEVLLVPAGEEHKRLRTLERLCEELADHGADRDSLLLALGGGVIGDLTGFLAAVYMRGVEWVVLPTTVLAQVDSSLGGKTGANLAAGKNLVGAFHPPLAVYSDIAALATLPQRELRAGLQEAVKSAVIRDRELFSFLEREQEAVLAGEPEALAHVVAACVRIKAAVVEADEREGGLRMILNLGHTLGHALEAATGYTALLHGEAVAWGMLAAFAIAQRRGTMTAAEAERSAALVRAYGPLRRFMADPVELVALTAKDKKNRGGTRSFVLPGGIGDATVVRDVTETELLRAAEEICTEARGLAVA